ncbi:MAG: winged helix-turn-helix transcriptional regulator, partial [Anaerolineae bacterium]|nr:winged helix-turn-helix transcriptional regulator [Anaerolineae bacterium]
MRIPLNRADERPLYTQIYHFLRQQIETEALPVGSRLPASRELAADLGVSRVTVINAIAELEAEGFVTSVQGSGAYVAEWQSLVEPLVGETALSAMHSAS